MNAQKSKADRRPFLASLQAVPVCHQRIADTDWFPAGDVTETRHGYLFEFDLPGLTRREIQISVAGNTLCLRGVRTTLRQGGTALRVERPAGEFVRRLPLPPDACGEEIQITLQEGVLHLHVPKQQQPGADDDSRLVSIEDQIYEHTSN